MFFAPPSMGNGCLYTDSEDRDFRIYLALRGVGDTRGRQWRPIGRRERRGESAERCAQGQVLTVDGGMTG